MPKITSQTILNDKKWLPSMKVLQVQVWQNAHKYRAPTILKVEQINILNRNHPAGGTVN